MLTLAPARGPFRPDPVAGYRLLPSPPSAAGEPYFVNRFGFRDRERAAAPSPGTRRIVGIGDSFVFGPARLDDGFLRVAERRLNAGALRPEWEVLLMGLGGYSPRHYVGVLRAAALPAAPDGVLLCFYVGNDILGVSTRQTVRLGELYSISSVHPGLSLLRGSWLFAYLEKRLSVGERRARNVRARTGSAPLAPERNEPERNEPERNDLERNEPMWNDPMRNDPDTLHAARSGRDPGGPEGADVDLQQDGRITRLYRAVLRGRLDVYLRRPDSRIEEHWRTVESLLAEFDVCCRQARTPWALVILPDEIQVDPEVRAQALLPAESERYDFDAPQTHLLHWAAARGVPALDLLPVFRAAQAGRGRLYLPNDTHWNAAGNRLAGEAVAEFMLGAWDGSFAAGARPAPADGPPLLRDGGDPR